MKKFLAALLAVIMVASMLPLSMIATSAAVPLPNDMTIVEDSESTLAPGIKENKMVVFDKNNNRVEMFVAVADPSVDTVGIYANYLDNQNETYGMQKTTEQAAAFEKNHPDHNVVVAINASYFNTNTGKPTGTFVMEGNDVTNESEGNNYPFFAILNDGTPIIASKGEYSSYKGQIKEAIGGYIHLVKDGAICSGLNKVDKYPRQTIGLTADGKVVLMTADNLAPKSNGLTIYEQAEVMLAMGCVEALHLDGGGSATYCSKAEGSDTLQVVNSPSNGTERTVSSTLVFTSTAVADGTFDHANLTAESMYVTAGTSVEIYAIGVDAAGGAAELPTEGITWQLKDASMGTVADGVFTAGNTTGTATVQMVYEGNVVGETNIYVVVPDAISFGREQIVVPYGETVDVALTATYGAAEVKYNKNDILSSLSNANAGTLSGLTISAPDASSNITDTILTASFKDTELTASVKLVFGKGSEVVFDFEEGSDGANLDNWILRTHESKIDNNELGEIYIVNEETGLVHDGEQALAFNADFSQSGGHSSNTGGYIALSLSWGGDPVSIKGAQNVGFWLYIPEDATTTEITLNHIYYDANGTPKRRTVDCYDDNGECIYTPYWSTNMEESGWHYVECDLSAYTDDLYIKDEPRVDGAYKRNFFIKIYCVFGAESEPFADYQGDFTYYIDNVTVDYSDAVTDRELPVFGDSYAYGDGVYQAKLAYGKSTTVTENTFSFSANVADNMTNSNYSGINAKSAKIYVDGVEVDASYAGGAISSESVTLLDGYHRIKFEIADNNGNVKAITREINVDTDADNTTVQLVPQDAELDRLLSGSVYWVDVVADDVASIKSVEALLNVNSINELVLDQMILAPGFKATYSSTPAQDAEKNALVKFERTGEAVDADSNVIASIPVRIWDYRMHETPGLEKNTPAYQWTAKSVNHRQLRVRVDMGLVTYTDNTTSTFSDKIVRDHEAYTDWYLMDIDYFNSKTSYHTHTAVAIDNKAATCTEAGYTGRTYCEACDSVVDWGTTIETEGHNFTVIDGKLACSVCDVVDKYTGLVEDETGTYYIVVGTAQTGWQYVNDAWYYFDTTTYAGVNGEFTYNQITYNLTNGKVDSGVWAKTLYGYRYYYGPNYHKNAFQTIDGKEYYFENGYRLEGGWQLTLDMSNEHRWYYFDENGVCDKDAVLEDGFYTDRNGYAYAKDGKGVRGLQYIDGNYYYFNWDGYAVTGTHADRLFGEDFKAVTGIMETANGLVYYKDGRPNMAGLINIDGDYYFAGGAKGELTVNEVKYVWKGNGFLPEAEYEFGPDGKMLQGIVEKDGTLYYYKNGKGTMAGLINIDGDYYFAGGAKGELTVNEYKYVWKTNGYLPEREYHFGPDGKMLNGVAPNANGVLTYYENGVAKMAGLVCIDGDYYFAGGAKGEVTVNEYKYVWKDNGLLPAREYHFGADGKMLDGIHMREDGVLCYYEKGVAKMAGLINIDGDYYFAGGAKGELTVNEYKYVWKTNGYLPEREYQFGPDGKMLQGIVEREDGVLCYYENGVAKMAGLVEWEGDYYFVEGAKGEIVVDQIKYVWKGNGILPEAEYEFDAEGKMLNGFVTKADGLYYYVNGKPGTAGLNYIDGYYYFMDYSGKLSVNKTQYVWKTNGLTIEMNYKFDELGRAVL